MKKYLKGYSLIELLVVIAVFSVLGIVITQSLATTLKGSKKSENTMRLRENIDYAVSVMEREIRGAKEITACSGNTLSYRDMQNNSRVLSCNTVTSGGVTIGAIHSTTLNGYLTSPTVGSAINITNCGNLFSCPAPASGTPPSVLISINAVEASNAGAEGASLDMTTKILTRIY